MEKIKDLVTYQEGSVVSREILSKTSGTVTVFAFDDNQGLSEHKAPFDALVQILEGETEVTVSKIKHHLVEGEMIIMPAGELHAIKALTKFKMLLTMIHS